MKKWPEPSVTIRPSAVAGRFYSADPGQLRKEVEALLRATEPMHEVAPLALIVPHAGYIYSGPVAASAYVRWQGNSGGARRILIVGPAHFVDVEGLAASSATAFETPLGLVPVDTEAVVTLVSKGLAQICDPAHSREHSIEVQLPFLQVVLEDFSIVPLLAGNTTAAQVADAIEALWTEEGTRVVISSDLTHYLDWASARRIDQSTACAIEALRPEDIGREQACGRTPICGLLEVAKRRKLRIRTLDLRNSGDTAGPRDQVVGYGAFAFA